MQQNILPKSSLQNQEDGGQNQHHSEQQQQSQHKEDHTAQEKETALEQLLNEGPSKGDQGVLEDLIREGVMAVYAALDLADIQGDIQDATQEAAALVAKQMAKKANKMANKIAEKNFAPDAVLSIAKRTIGDASDVSGKIGTAAASFSNGAAVALTAVGAAGTSAAMATSAAARTAMTSSKQENTQKDRDHEHDDAYLKSLAHRAGESMYVPNAEDAFLHTMSQDMHHQLNAGPGRGDMAGNPGTVVSYTFFIVPNCLCLYFA